MGEMFNGLSNFDFVGNGGGVRIGRDDVDSGFRVSRNHKSFLNGGNGIIMKTKLLIFAVCVALVGTSWGQLVSYPGFGIFNGDQAVAWNDPQGYGLFDSGSGSFSLFLHNDAWKRPGDTLGAYVLVNGTPNVAVKSDGSSYPVGVDSAGTSALLDAGATYTIGGNGKPVWTISIQQALDALYTLSPDGFYQALQPFIDLNPSLGLTNPAPTPPPPPPTSITDILTAAVNGSITSILGVLVVVLLAVFTVYIGFSAYRIFRKILWKI